MPARSRRWIRALYVLAWMPLLALYTLAYGADPGQGNRCGLGGYGNPGGQSKDEFIVFATVE